MGPSALLRLATIVTLGLSLLVGGCATATSEGSRGSADEKSGWTRCARPQNTTLTVVCLSR